MFGWLWCSVLLSSTELSWYILFKWFGYLLFKLFRRGFSKRVRTLTHRAFRSDIFKRVLMRTLRAFQSWFSNDFSCVHFILVLTTLFSNMWTELLLHRLRFAASAWAGGDLFFSFLQFRFHSNMTIWYKKVWICFSWQCEEVKRVRRSAGENRY